MGHPTAQAIVHKDEVIARIANGEPLTSIALDLGYASHSGIVERLGDDPEYQKAMRSGIIGKIERREKQLESADSNVTVTRADRLLGHARWWAERLDPQRFGAQKEQAQAPIQVVIQVYESNEEKVIVQDRGDKPT